MSKKHLEIGLTPAGDPFTLPADLGDKKFALLAQSKKGKTYGLGDVLEELTEAQRPWGAFDPGNNLWGLRVLRDGTPSGLPIVVMGGDHQDLPLEKDAGERVAEAFLSTPVCMIFDVSFESKNVTRKFVTDFCGRLMQIRSPIERVVFFEEAPEFVPQGAKYPGIQVCKAAVDKLVRIGGNFGYGTWLISQRSATIDKDVLSQCEALIVMGLTDTRDRKAVKDWMVAKDIDQKMAQCFDELGSLKPGEAWLWWPGEDRFERFTFRERRTLHPREMKKLGINPNAVQLGNARAFVERLKRELTKTQAVVAAGVAKRERGLHAVDPVTAMEISADVGAALEGAQDAVRVHRNEIGDLAVQNGKLQADLEYARTKLQETQTKLAGQRALREDAERRLAAVRDHLRPTYDAYRKLFEEVGDEPGSPPVDRGVWEPWLQKAGQRGCRRMLEVLIERSQVTRNQLGTLSSVASTKSTFRNYLSWLKSNGLVEIEGDLVKLRSV
ncbi:MAG: hypothetical protein ACRD1X_12450 [Vicinamibacteria bacterium]